MSIDGSSRLVLAITALAVFGCGAETPEESLSSAQLAVIDGIPAPEATNIVMVFDNAAGLGTTTCTGALIAPNVVLTSRTCVSDDPTMPWDCTSTIGAAHAASQVFVTNDQEVSYAATPWNVQSIAVPDDATICGNSIALLILSDVVDSSAAVPLEPRLDAPVTVGETFTAYGYGATTVGGTDSGTRNKRDGILVTCVGDCEGAVASEWGGGIGACVGDGPAVGEDNLLVGLASRGGADCESMIFEGLEAHADWLREQVAAAAATGGYTPPAWAGGPADGGAAGASGGGGEAGSGATGGASGTGGGTADEDDSGCSCTVRSPGATPFFLLFAAAAALAAFRRRSSPK